MSTSAPPPPPHHPLDGSAAFEPRTNTKKNHLGGSRTDKRSEIARALTNHIRHTERDPIARNKMPVPSLPRELWEHVFQFLASSSPASL